MEHRYTAKPAMIVAGTHHYPTRELTEFSSGLASHFDVTLRGYEELEAGEIVPFLLIVISVVAQGFLESMGKEAWRLLKERISKLIIRPNSEFSDLELQLRATERTLTFKCRSNDRRIFESALDKAELIAKSNTVKKGTQEYVFDQKKDRWNFIEEDSV